MGNQCSFAVSVAMYPVILVLEVDHSEKYFLVLDCDPSSWCKIDLGYSCQKICL